MFKVECPGCKAPYQVDERRIPPNGLKMRCPKCGTSFKVDPPSDPHRTGPSPVLGGALGVGADSVPPPVIAPRSQPLKSTMVGVAPAIGAPERSKAARPPPPKAAPPPPSAPAVDLDLPSPVPDAGLPLPAAPKAAPPRRAPPPPRPAAAKPAVPPALAPEAAASAVRSFEAELPSPASPKPHPEPLEVDDLPAVVGHAPARAPMPSPPPRAPSPSFGEIELDLPAPTKQQARPPSAATNRADPRAPTAFDLPAVVAPTATGLDIDLPELAHDLPSPATPAPPDWGEIGLPSPGRAELPSVSEAGLPRPADGALGARANESAATLRPRARDSFGEIDLPLVTPAIPATSTAPGTKKTEPMASDPFGEAPLPPPRSLSGSSPSISPDSFQLPPLELPQPTDGVVRQQGGGTSYGEVNLAPSAPAEVPLEAPAVAPPASRDDDMEFGEVPQEKVDRPVVGAAQPAARIPTAAPPPDRVVAKPPRRLRGVKIAGALFVVLVGGAALALEPSIGPFGVYWIQDRLRAGEYQALVAETTQSGRRRIQADTYPAAKAALRDAESARASAKRVPALSAYAAYLGFLRELRFGNDAETHARAKVLLEELDAEDATLHTVLARAGRAATEGQLARARQTLQGVLTRAARDPDVLALKGEVELRARDSKAALTAWNNLAQIEQSARAAFGLARARFSGGDTKGAESDAEQALARNPEHLGARILLAQIASGTREREHQAVKWLEDIARRPQMASPNELVLTHTLLGDIHLSRSRISRAEGHYDEALKIDPKAARALLGLGESLFRAGRYSEAQARFEAASQADPDAVLAKIGVAKSKLMLERVEDAHASLEKLRESHPDSTSAAYWFGRALEAFGKRDQAERVYQDALRKAPSGAAVVDVYISLALLQLQLGRGADAQKTLQTARERLPDSPQIHVALGDVAMRNGRYAEAAGEFRRALSLDPEELSARFKLASASWREGKATEALQELDRVRAVDADYPGLALEYGLILEQLGRTDEALEKYLGQLAKAPEDTDLMLRIGCAYSSGSRTKEAQELLRKVLAVRPTSAETHFCLGRALLREGSRLADALRLFERAVELDPHKPVHHLYVGWAANDAGDVPKAERALDQAIKLDQGLADAYWQRGVLRLRQGATRDSIADLTRALELNPARVEARASLASAYFDSGKEPLALAEWKKAVTAKPDNAEWRFRYGKLLAANQMNEAARTELTAALSLASKSERPELWVWEAHHALARALMPRPEAAEHWEQFLRLGPSNSPYRQEAIAALKTLGRPWSPR